LRFLVDTKVISELSKRDRAHPNVARCAAATPAPELGTSVLVLDQMRCGIELKRRSDPRQD
jgi:predicted nucleic acid-binding protein